MKPYDAYRLSIDNPSKFKKNKDYYENIISNSFVCSYNYARDTIKGRFELGEKAIATDPLFSCLYASNILRGRFELGEKAISTNCGYSLDYSRNALKGRFELGEYSIVAFGITYHIKKYIINNKNNKTPIHYKFI